MMMKCSAAIFAVLAWGATAQTGNGIRGGILPDEGFDEEYHQDGHGEAGSDNWQFQIGNGMVPPPEWKHRFLTESLADRLSESTDSYHGVYFERMLADDGTWRAPTHKEVADMIIAELNLQKEANVNGTADFSAASARVAEKLLGESPLENATKAQWLIDLLVIPESSPEYAVVEDAVITTTTNNSICSAPGKCMTQERMIAVKNFIKAMLNDYIKTNQEPVVSDIYEKLKTVMDIEGEQADQLIKSSPRIRKYLKSKMRKTQRVVVKKDMFPQAKKVEKILIDAGNNFTEFEDALSELGGDMTEDDVSSLMTALSYTDRKKILTALAKPKEDMAKSIAEAYKKQNQTQAGGTGNHTYFVEGVTDNQGRRVLRYHPHPDDMGYDDHLAAFEKERHRRRLSEDHLLPEHVDDWTNRLDDHIDELQGHIRELRLSCTAAQSSTRCVNVHLDNEAKELTRLGGLVKTELQPLTSLLGKMQSSRATIDSVYTVANAVFVAIKIAANIPQIGKIFDIVKLGMKPIHTIFKQINGKSKTFDNNIRINWDRAISTVERVMAAFDPSKIYYVVQGAGVIASIGESQCLKAAVNHVAGSDLVGTIEAGVGAMKQYIESLFAAVRSLNQVLAGATWDAMAKTLNGIVRAIEPVRVFFAPFAPIGALIKKKIRIQPWFRPPRGQTKFGGNRCDAGYDHDPILRKTCREKNSWHWERFALPYRMRLTCRHAGHPDHWTGECANHIYHRASSNYNGPGCNCGCWACTCPHCWGFHCANGGYKHSWWMPWKCHEHCRGGYTEVLDTCRRNDCGWGYLANWPDKSLCIKTHNRWQYSRGTNCDHYNNRKHWQEHYIQDIFGQCWASCRSGESGPFLGMCFPSAVLEVSIQDIFNAFEAVFDFIKNIPGLKQVLDAIDMIVGIVLKPVTDKIGDWIRGALNLPNFPTINADFMPFAPFQQVAIDMPQPPDMSALTDLPSKVFNNVLRRLPDEFSAIADCGLDVVCMSEKVGLGNPADLLDPILAIFKELDGASELFTNLIGAVKCGKMDTKSIPVSDLLASIGFPDINACDVDINYCSSLDMSGAKDIIEQMKALFEPVLTTMTNLVGRRRLAAWPDQFMPIIGINIGPALVGDRNYADFARKIETLSLFLAPYKWVNGKWIRQAGKDGKVALNTGEKQPVGLHYRIEGAFYFDIGLLIRNGEWKFGMELGSKIEFKFGTAIGADRLLKDTISLADDDLMKFWKRDEYKQCYPPKFPPPPTPPPKGNPRSTSTSPPMDPNIPPPPPVPNKKAIEPQYKLGDRPKFSEAPRPMEVGLPKEALGPLPDEGPRGSARKLVADDTDVPLKSDSTLEIKDESGRVLNEIDFDWNDAIPVDLDNAESLTRLVGWNEDEETEVGVPHQSDRRALITPPRGQAPLPPKKVPFPSQNFAVYKPIPGYEDACVIIEQEWLPAIQDQTIPLGCDVDSMIKIRDDKFQGSMFNENGPSKADTWKITKCVQFWYGRHKALAVAKKVFDRRVKWDKFKKEKGGKGGPLFYLGSITVEDLWDRMLLKTQWIVNLIGAAILNKRAPFVLAKQKPKYFGADTALGTVPYTDLIGFWIGVENKDNKSKSRLGPVFKLGYRDIMDAAKGGKIAVGPGNFNMGEFKIRQMYELMKIGGFGLIPKSPSLFNQAMQKARSELWTGFSDQYLSTFVAVTMGGVVDIEAPAYKGCYESFGMTQIGRGFSLDKCIYHCRNNAYGFAAMNLGDQCFCDVKVEANKGLPPKVFDNGGTQEAGFEIMCYSPCTVGKKGTTMCGGGGTWYSVWSTNGLYFS